MGFEEFMGMLDEYDADDFCTQNYLLDTLFGPIDGVDGVKEVLPDRMSTYSLTMVQTKSLLLDREDTPSNIKNECIGIKRVHVKGNYHTSDLIARYYELRAMDHAVRADQRCETDCEVVTFAGSGAVVGLIDDDDNSHWAGLYVEDDLDWCTLEGDDEPCMYQEPNLSELVYDLPDVVGTEGLVEEELETLDTTPMRYYLRESILLTAGLKLCDYPRDVVVMAMRYPSRIRHMTVLSELIGVKVGYASPLMITFGNKGRIDPASQISACSVFRFSDIEAGDGSWYMDIIDEYLARSCRTRDAVLFYRFALRLVNKRAYVVWRTNLEYEKMLFALRRVEESCSTRYRSSNSNERSYRPSPLVRSLKCVSKKYALDWTVGAIPYPGLDSNYCCAHDVFHCVLCERVVRMNQRDEVQIKPPNEPTGYHYELYRDILDDFYLRHEFYMDNVNTSDEVWRRYRMIESCLSFLRRPGIRVRGSIVTCLERIVKRTIYFSFVMLLISRSDFPLIVDSMSNVWKLRGFNPWGSVRIKNDMR